MTITPALLPPPTGTAEPGLLLRLCGPLQSWGERSHFNERDTAPFPTRSGIVGLLASALGRRRTEPVDDLRRLSLTVRTDRPGVLLRDLHTVGGGLPAKATVTTAEGKKRSGDTTTVLTHRTYLADAAFTLALTLPPATQDLITSEDAGDLLAQCAEALRCPQWPLYLGRRSCPPEGPVLLGHTDDTLHHLLHLPLAAEPPGAGTPGIEFLSDRPLDRLPTLNRHVGEDAHPATEVNDEPLSFHPRHRAYRVRPLYRRTLHLPRLAYAGLGTEQLHITGGYLATHLNRL